MNGRNKITAINTLDVVVLRYGAGILMMAKDEGKELDRNTRKKMTMSGTFNLMSDVDRLCIPRNKRREGTRWIRGLHKK